MEYKCEICNKNFNSKESLEQHNFMKHSTIEKKPISLKKYFIWTMIGLILVLIVLSVNNYLKNSQAPGKYDNFAKCLTEKGVVIYGNDFCQYTTKQLNFFGKSKKYLNYIKCIENEALCDEKGVKITPTWEINGKTYPQVQTFEALAGYSECEL